MLLRKGTRVEAANSLSLGPGLELDHDADGNPVLQHTAAIARADTSGASSTQLETEVNYLKTVLRNAGLLAP